MSFFEKILRGSRSSDDGNDGLHCRHGSLSPMWENIDDMGNADKISRYRCLDCGVFLSTAAAPRDATRHDATSTFAAAGSRDAA
jgi:hypothetical protein